MLTHGRARTSDWTAWAGGGSWVDSVSSSGSMRGGRGRRRVRVLPMRPSNGNVRRAHHRPGGTRTVGAQAAEPPFATVKVGDGSAQVLGAEVGPEYVEEIQLGIGRLPQQEVGQPLFAAGADEEIDVRLNTGAGRRQEPPKRCARGGVCKRPTHDGVGNGIA